MYDLSKEQKDLVLKALRAPVSLEMSAAVAGLKVKVLEDYLQEVYSDDTLLLTGFGGEMLQAMAEGMLDFMERLKEGKTAQEKAVYFDVAKRTLDDIASYMNHDKVKQFKEQLNG